MRSSGRLMRTIRRAVGLPAGNTGASVLVDHFSYLPVARDTALVRVRGRWRAPQGVRMPKPILVVDPGRIDHRVAPLDKGFPFPAAGQGAATAPWRASYLAPLDAFVQSGGFALELEGLPVQELPGPVAHLPPATEATDRAPAEVGVLDTRLSELDAAITRQRAHGGRPDPNSLRPHVDVARGAAHVLRFKLAAQRDRLVGLQSELERTRSTADAQREQLSAAFAESERRAATAEARAALAGADVLSVRDRVSQLENQGAHLVLRLSAAHTRADAAEQARAVLEEQVLELGAQVVDLERQVAEHVVLRAQASARSEDEAWTRAALEARATELAARVAELQRHGVHVLA